MNKIVLLLNASVRSNKDDEEWRENVHNLNDLD